MATIASMALPRSARTARPASTAVRWGAATTPRRCPAVWSSIGTLARRLDVAALAHEYSAPARVEQRTHTANHPALAGRGR